MKTKVLNISSKKIVNPRQNGILLGVYFESSHKFHAFFHSNVDSLKKKKFLANVGLFSNVSILYTRCVKLKKKNPLNTYWNLVEHCLKTWEFSQNFP